jgi:hypothetical protein
MSGNVGRGYCGGVEEEGSGLVRRVGWRPNWAGWLTDEGGLLQPVVTAQRP